MVKKILYITHYGSTPRDFYCDLKTGKPKRIIGDGGSNIHIHLIQYFLSQKIKVSFSTFKNHYQYLAFFGDSPNVGFLTFWTPQLLIGRYSFLLDNFYKILFLPLKAFFVNVNYGFIFSSTDFLPDAIYAFILKIRNPKIKWVASYFLEAPKPWVKDNPYRTSWRRCLRGVLYWLFQRFSYWLTKWKADFILVTSKPDVEKFITSKRKRKKIIVVQGGVDINSSVKYLKGKIIPLVKRKYDACFLGRLHYQKGVLELIDIWQKVCQKQPESKLAMIGNGPLEREMRKKIKKYYLNENIDLLGFRSGKEKYQIFSQSKIMVHPATYDSGGMSAAEGMAWGLPGVGFDLESLKTYYPKGMKKAPKGDFEKFAKIILKLLTDKTFYQKTSRDAVDLIRNTWSWDVRAKGVYQQLEMDKNE